MQRQTRSRLHAFRIPDDAERIFQADVWRRNSHHEWNKRKLILTKEDLHLTYDHHDLVIEKIPLVTVVANDNADFEIDRSARIFFTSMKLRLFRSWQEVSCRVLNKRSLYSWGLSVSRLRFTGQITALPLISVQVPQPFFLAGAVEK